MKVGIVCVNLSFIAGGPRLVLGLAQALKNAGHQVKVFAPDFDPSHYKEAAAGLDIRIIEPKAPLIWTGRPAGFFGWIAQKIEQERRLVDAAKRIALAMETDFDVINVHDFAYPAAYYCKLRNPNAKIIWTENAPPFLFISKGSFLRDLMGKIYEWWKKTAGKKYFQAMDEAIVTDRFNENWCRDKGIRKISIIRNGVDFEKFYAPVKDFTEKAKKNKVQLFALGALNVYRRYDVVMHSVKILRDKGVDARAVIVANNIWKEDAVKNDLLKLLGELKLEPYIDFRFAGVSDEELHKIYRESDIFVQAVYITPPGQHGWGIVNFEGMSAGLPLILVNSASATEVLADGESAFYVDPLSAEQIADKVGLCIKDPALCRRVAEAGQNIARGLAWDKYTERTIALFKERTGAVPKG